MTKLEITVNKNKEAYLEYKGKKLEYVHDEAWRNDAEDIDDESFKIIMKYYLTRGGMHEVEVGYIK